MQIKTFVFYKPNTWQCTPRSNKIVRFRHCQVDLLLIAKLVRSPWSDISTLVLRQDKESFVMELQVF